VSEVLLVLLFNVSFDARGINRGNNSQLLPYFDLEASTALGDRPVFVETLKCFSTCEVDCTYAFSMLRMLKKSLQSHSGDGG
jgi:hypothetical protein